MKFTAGISAILVLASTAAAGVVSLDARDLPSEGTCIGYAKLSGIHKFTRGWSPACSVISRDCNKKLKDTVFVWSKTSCVAAATCESPESVVQFARCPGGNQAIPELSAVSPLSTNIYRNIVGPCADQGCPITQQNYVDFIYSSLSAVNSTQWPELIDVESWWRSMKEWTNTGETIPYANFNDLLHYRTDY
ncbi:hypothetical protein BDV98DRAFT_313234 [Pterulicium gracile]|uniref:Uncharacterized protein n=1 Tax=Pterulicium gracile TaxID=1884261 RepID=A0A5C3QRZ5_9AGAR|nr:hypothetical protein BDV98DRAFT_313234 [Pterula gracilis]